MTKSLLTTIIASLLTMSLFANKLDVKEFRYSGPYPLMSPVMTDSVDLNGAKFETKSLLQSNINLDLVKDGQIWSGEELPQTETPALHLLSFDFQNRKFFNGTLKLDKAPKDYQLFIDGKKASAGSLTLTPGSHSAVIKYLSQKDQKDSLKVSIEASDSLKANDIALMNFGDKRMYTVNHLLDEWRLDNAAVSPDGKYVIKKYSRRAPRENESVNELVEIATGRIISDIGSATWMPKSNKYYYTRRDRIKGRELVTVDPATGVYEVIASNLPAGGFTFSPNEDFLIFSVLNQGKKELNSGVFETVHPKDRQRGWRNRYSLAKYDLKTGVMQPLTMGFNSVYRSDISEDGRYLFFMKQESYLESRPTTVNSLYRLDLQTMALDTLVSKDGFLKGATVSPDGKSVLLRGTPEALDNVGKNVKEGLTPSIYDVQYFLMDIESRKIRPVTKDFNPSVTGSEIWNKSDNQIYFTANHRDSIVLYRMNPTDGKITKIYVPEDVVLGFDIAEKANTMLVLGQSATNSDRLYSIDLKTIGKKNGAVKLIDDYSAKNLEGVQIAECKPWTFKNSIGDEITCRYYSPVGQEEGKKYPMIVYYYGGCSPVERTFESRYPWQCWASLGYVVLVVEASGAAGFGQDFSARHVNTAGVDPARDIIEATKTFCKEHPYVNEKRIGCCGASYGGFMTQYLQTVTDIFAAAISHAGISDHTTYWGYGYWGYSYSEVSMANSYPWSHQDLYVKQSPIYNVDKIHTPILFLHGNADMNVPYNNSVQMFTALKLLGRETALVTVDGEEHHILDYDKCLAWSNTILAWFQKYLQDDDSWWEALYPKKNLY